MELSYEEIRRIHRLEKNSARLVEVDQEFYSELTDFLSDEKKSYLDSLRDLSSSKARDFTNLKKMVEEIFALRSKKILSRALIASRTGEASEDHMATQEKQMFRSLLSTLKKHSSILEEIFVGKQDSKKALNKVGVEILSEVPEFVGVDMKDYGPFSKGEVVELPFKIAKFLSEKKLAEVKS